MWMKFSVITAQLSTSNFPLIDCIHHMVADLPTLNIRTATMRRMRWNIWTVAKLMGKRLQQLRFYRKGNAHQWDECHQCADGAVVVGTVHQIDLGVDHQCPLGDDLLGVDLAVQYVVAVAAIAQTARAEVVFCFILYHLIHSLFHLLSTDSKFRNTKNVRSITTTQIIAEKNHRNNKNIKVWVTYCKSMNKICIGCIRFDGSNHLL